MKFAPADLLDQLRVLKVGVFPLETLTEIINRKDEFEEVLLDELNEILANPEEAIDYDNSFPIYLVYLLAQFRIKRAWKPLLAILALPDEMPGQLLEDLIYDDMGNILASVYDGDDQPLRDLLENPEANEAVRAATVMDTYRCLLATGQIEKNQVEAYFADLLNKKLEREPGCLWDELVQTCSELRFVRLLPAIEKAFDEGLCDDAYDTFDIISKTIHLAPSKEDLEEWGLVDDAIDRLSDWMSVTCDLDPSELTTFAPQKISPLSLVIRSEPITGRNDPCPCGSGKKFKKCCGDEAAKSAAARAATEKLDRSILKVRIELADSNPIIWREVLMSGSSTLADLHELIQDVMPWDDGHLHCFRHRTIDPRLANSGNFPGTTSFERQTRLHAIVDSDETLVYTYDFGDDWEHLITITVWNEDSPPASLPHCIGGENAAPPEDCGGIWGYSELIEIIQNKKHREHESMIEWLGEDFDPTHFDLSETNANLR